MLHQMYNAMQSRLSQCCTKCWLLVSVHWTQCVPKKLQSPQIYFDISIKVRGHPCLTRACSLAMTGRSRSQWRLGPGGSTCNRRWLKQSAFILVNNFLFPQWCWQSWWQCPAARRWWSGRGWGSCTPPTRAYTPSWVTTGRRGWPGCATRSLLDAGDNCWPSPGLPPWLPPRQVRLPGLVHGALGQEWLKPGLHSGERKVKYLAI